MSTTIITVSRSSETTLVCEHMHNQRVLTLFTSVPICSCLSSVVETNHKVNDSKLLKYCHLLFKYIHTEDLLEQKTSTGKYDWKIAVLAYK